MEYLFPFDKIPQNAKIIIYGAGKVGQLYLSQICMTKYCHVICIVDKNKEFYKDFYETLGIKIILPKEINEYLCDLFLIAVRSKQTAGAISKILINKYLIEEEKIIYVGEKKFIPQIIYNSNRDFDIDFAYNICNKISLAIEIKGGFGDVIVRKKFVEQILKWGENILLDVFVDSNIGDFSRILYSDLKQVFNVIENTQIYDLKQKNYDVAISLGPILRIDKKIKNKKYMCVDIYDKFKHMEKVVDDYDISDKNPLMNAIHYARCKKDKLNCYTTYNRYGDININDYKVFIPLCKEYEKNFNELKLNKYITINYGWGGNCTTVDTPAAKVWPIGYYREFIKLFKRAYPNIVVVQLGVKDAYRVEGVDRLFLGYSMEIVKYILKNTIFHLDCEGGLVHLATQLGTKCIVLFGQTPMEYYSYMSNINISTHICDDCCWLTRNFQSCYRNLEKPECMYSIKPALVFRNVKSYMKSIGY